MHDIPSEEVGMVAVNGFHVGKNRTLHDQEDVNLYPPLKADELSIGSEYEC